MEDGFLGHPFGVGRDGRIAATGLAGHVRDMVSLVLFTSPGERPNRPDFGCALPRALFAPNDPALGPATEFMVHGALDRWLGDVIKVERVRVTHDGARLGVDVVYVLRETGELREERFAAPRDGAA